MSITTYPKGPIFLEWSLPINHEYYRFLRKLELYPKLKMNQRRLIESNSTEVQAIFARISPSEVNIRWCFCSQEQITGEVYSMTDAMIKSGSGDNFFDKLALCPKQRTLGILG
jgi:hypothetical protein